MKSFFDENNTQSNLSNVIHLEEIDLSWTHVNLGTVWEHQNRTICFLNTRNMVSTNIILGFGSHCIEYGPKIDVCASILGNFVQVRNRINCCIRREYVSIRPKLSFEVWEHTLRASLSRACFYSCQLHNLIQ